MAENSKKVNKKVRTGSREKAFPGDIAKAPVKGTTVIGDPLIKVDPRISSLGSVQSLVYKIAIRDNTEFYSKFDKDRFKGIVTRPTKTIVVSQDPDPGDFVPAGTPVNLVLVAKDDIPVGTFKGIDVAVVNKFENIGALQADLENLDDTVEKDAKDVLNKNVEYNALSSGDKLAIDTYLSKKFGDQAIVTEEKKAKVYNDVKFLRNI